MKLHSLNSEFPTSYQSQQELQAAMKGYSDSCRLSLKLDRNLKKWLPKHHKQDGLRGDRN